MDDSKAVARLRRGDPGGLEPLVRRYQAPAVRVAYLIVRDRALAEQAAQDAFLAAYQDAHSLARAAFGPWLLRKVGAAATALAARWEEAAPGAVQAENAALAPPDPDLAAILGAAHSIPALWAALGALPPGARAAVVLRYYAGALGRPDGPSPGPPPGGAGEGRATLLIQTLQEYAAHAVPATLDLWPAVRDKARALPPPARPPAPPRSPALAAARRAWGDRRPVLLTVVGLLVALLGAVGVLSRSGNPIELLLLWVTTPGSAPVNGQRQTVSGYTVALQAATADANRIVISYTVSAPSDRAFTGFVAAPSLVDAEGRAYPLSGEGGRIAHQAVPAGTTSDPDVLVFDATLLDHIPARLDLALSLSLQDVAPRAGDESGRGAGWGPFRFRFPVVVDRSQRALAQPQTVRTAGVTMILERVVVTASETRLILRYTPPPGGSATQVWRPLLSLQAGAHDLTLGTSGAFPAPHVYEHRIGWALLAEPGAWTLRVSELMREDSPATRVRGPWIFQFTLPPATTAAAP
jgi:RNA polymerase sigma-70 factor (ECF subfamily)